MIRLIIAIAGYTSEQQLKNLFKLTEEEKTMQAAKSKYFTRLKITE